MGALLLLAIIGLLIFLVPRKDVLNDRNESVARALDNHHVTIVAGDSKRLAKIRPLSHYAYQTQPLTNCAEPKSGSPADLNGHSFAVLISYDNKSTCQLSDAIKLYGKPNASSLIAGTFNQPVEKLLFYDRGINKASQGTTMVPSTVDPAPLSRLKDLTCSGPTIMNIVAHQDDDLLFINPDTLHAIRAGYCVRTIYMTAGDAGRSRYYWLAREQGSETAYDYMDGPTPDIWVKRIAELPDHQYIRVDSPVNNPKVSLIFLRLPDGNLNGRGFATYHNQSLENLESGNEKNIISVDGQSSYTYTQLISTLASLMQIYKPNEIRTQANYVAKRFPDHSDHMAVGRYVKKAYAQYGANVPINFYIGYPVDNFPPNVTGMDVQDTENAFFKYAQYDDATCKDIKSCTTPHGYYLYFDRQYTYSK